MEKAFTWTLCFDVLESRKFKLCQKQSNGECLMGMFMVLLCYIGRDDSYNSQGVVYAYRRGAFALLVSTELGNARALVRGTSNR